MSSYLFPCAPFASLYVIISMYANKIHPIMIPSIINPERTVNLFNTILTIFTSGFPDRNDSNVYVQGTG